MTRVTGSGLRIGVIAAITLVSAACAPSALGAKADLSVTKVAGAPAAALTGTAPQLTVTVKNAGGKRSKRSGLFAQLVTTDGTALGGSFGKASVDPIDAGRKRTVKFRPKVPFEAVGDWRLGVCVAPGSGANDCGESDIVEFSDGSTIGRIDAALGDGDITKGEALLYKLYAVRGDGRLPGEYDGGGPLPTGVVLADVASAYSALPAADKAAVEPFMLQPRYEESAWAPDWAHKVRLAAPLPAKRRDPCHDTTEIAGAWSGIESAHAVFWYRPGNAAAQSKAQTLSGEFEAHVWPDLTGLFMPVDDTAAAPCDPAGDSRIDVYIDSGNTLLTSRNAAGVAPAMPFTTCGPNPAFMVLPSNATRFTLAHEFTHVIQAAYPVCNREPAWVEGTANWAGNYVYEDDNDEHRDDRGMANPGFSLRDSALSYDSWPFWYSLEVNDDAEALVRVFEAMSGGFAGALEAGPSDGLEKAWKRYSVERWNQVPIGSAGFPLAESFKQSDGFSAKPATVPTVDVKLGGMQQKLFPVATELEQRPLSTFFNRVKITDPLVRQVEFENADHGIPGTIVQAFLKLQSGEWKLKDLSSQGKLTLCRDKPEENVTEIVIATSNANPGGDPLGNANHFVTAKDVCEQPTYSGTFSGTTRLFDSQMNQFDVTTDFNGTLLLTPYDGPGASGHEWHLTTGSLHISSFDGFLGNCTVEGGGESFTLPETNSEYAIAMVLSGGRYFANLPWVTYNPPATIAITASGPPEDCDNFDEYPLGGIGQYMTLTPATGVEPDENGVISVTNLDNHSDPQFQHDDFNLTLTPVP